MTNLTNDIAMRLWRATEAAVAQLEEDHENDSPRVGICCDEIDKVAVNAIADAGLRQLVEAVKWTKENAWDEPIAQRKCDEALAALDRESSG